MLLLDRFSYRANGRSGRIAKLGQADFMAASSALEIALTPGCNLGSGLYWLDKGNGPYQAWCDMETDGGGWEKVDFMVNISAKGSSGRTRGSFSTLDATSCIRVTGAIDSAGSYVTDTAPLPFAAEYMVKSFCVQFGGGGYNHKPALRIGQPMAGYNDQRMDFDHLRNTTDWAIGQYGVSIVSRIHQNARRYQVGTLWDLTTWREKAEVGTRWIDAASVTDPPAWPGDRDVYFGVSTWSDSGTTCQHDHSVWIRGG